MKNKNLSKDTEEVEDKKGYNNSKQEMSDFITQDQDKKSIISIQNHKFDKSSINYEDIKKYFVIQLQIHKKMMPLRLFALRKQIMDHRNRLSKQEILIDINIKEQKIILQNKKTSINQKISYIQEKKIKDIKNKYQIQKLKYIRQKINDFFKEVNLQKKKVFQIIQKIKINLKKQENQILILNKQNKEIYEEKKQLNNLLQQAKGNIRVYCRLKPVYHERISYQINHNLIKLQREKTDIKSKNIVEEYDFLFQKIFEENIPQNIVFQQLAQLIQCSVDGKNVCIFAYGQTGSGKTHTMTGSLDGHKHEMRGFIPRSIQYIFDQVQISKTMGFEANIYLTICEVYNDKVFDLLSSDIQKDLTQDSKKRGFEFKYSKSMLASSSKSNLNQQKSTQTLIEIIVRSPQQALLTMLKALKFRKTAQTKMNKQSSRSHLIFEIRNEFYNPHTKISRCSSLILIDLAGSERQKDTAVTGIRFQEAKSINNSLTQLGKVLRAIKNGEKTTFRNCKLTMILQKYLVSDSKAVMFVNVSTDKKDLDQTINSLNFAQSVRQCKIKNNKNLKSNQIF